ANRPSLACARARKRAVQGVDLDLPDTASPDSCFPSSIAHYLWDMRWHQPSIVPSIAWRIARAIAVQCLKHAPIIPFCFAPASLRSMLGALLVDLRFLLVHRSNVLQRQID